MVKVWNMAIASKELASRQAILVGLLTYNQVVTTGIFITISQKRGFMEISHVDRCYLL